ncbi:Gfo/Idh/MocA family protein [Gryllotalpicola reticulitermitis]|uniref:Gfo/Idh/MocA family protein n=1 Tax=Gryllotalpicola reticulitermitis TaxID=1184153 RepID=A0ABV8Q7K1_9MICO
MSVSFKAAVVGLGWAGQQHLAAYSRRDDVEIVGLAGLEADQLSALATQYGVDHAFADWNDLIAWGGFDLLSVAVPTSLHAPIAIAALQSGSHVLCEKPMAGTVADAQAMVDAAKSSGLVLDVVFNHRSHGELKAIKRLVADGGLGNPYHTRVTWLRRDGIPAGWFRQRALSGGGVLADLGIHLLDYTLDILGEPAVRSLSAAGFSAFSGERSDARPLEGRGESSDVEDFASVFLRLAGGGVIELDVSWAAARASADEMTITVHGTEGGAEAALSPAFEAGDVERFTAPTVGGESETIETPAGRGHDEVVAEFVAAAHGSIGEGRRVGSAALERTRIIGACYESMVSGREVVLA